MRVIDVLPFADTDADRVQLLETMERPCGQYVALSYVWGKTHSMRLVQATRNCFLGGIALEELPKTLQDAVRVTRSLDVRYLWIDSLCILQDSDSDKEMQIPYMNEYYRGAVAVISASGAADVHAGFLRPQETESSVLARVESQVVDFHDEQGPVPHRFPFWEPVSGELALLTVDIEPCLYNYDEEPINKRGWTLQESALARRLLTFPSTGGIVLRCHERERFGGEMLSNPFHEDPAFGYPETRDHPQRSEAELFQKWAETVQDYSRRSLSQPGDVLVALGALALETYTRDGAVLGKYVAGLWTNTLLKGLLWHVLQAPHPDRKLLSTPGETDPQYHAPSWSWASCGQPILFRTEREPDLSLGNYEKEEPSWCIEILQCAVTPRSGLSPFGAVESGYVEIRGYLFPIRTVSKDGGSEPGKDDVEDVALVTGERYHDDKSDIFAPDSVYALALIDSSCSWLPLYDATRSRCRGLIVRQIDTDRYRRLGFAEFSSYPEMSEHTEKRTIRLV